MTNQEQYEIICENAKKYETILEDLKKVRAQILEESDYAYADFDDYKQCVLDVEVDDLPYDDFRYGMQRALEIINDNLEV